MKNILWFNKNKGFTMIELIVVIAIIAVLSGIVVGSVNQYQAKARDARRKGDMQQIIKALLLYQADNGCIPRTFASTCPNAGGYSENNTGGFDDSYINGFLTFLQTGGYMQRVKDPIEGSNYFYRYYCYNQTEASYNGGYAGLYLAYYKEVGGRAQVVLISGAKGSNFICK